MQKINTFYRIVCLFLCLGMFSCEDGKKKKGVDTENKKLKDAGENTAMEEQIFMGTLPCPDCLGIQTELRLKEKIIDGKKTPVFQLIEKYRGTKNGNDRIEEKNGNWRQVKKNIGDSLLTELQLSIEKDTAFRRVFAFEKQRKQLRQVDQLGRPIPSDLYILKAVKEFEGMLMIYADAPVFRVCKGDEMPIAIDSEAYYQAEKSYILSGAGEKQYLYCRLKGYISKGYGGQAGEMFHIAHFIELNKLKNCPK